MKDSLVLAFKLMGLVLVGLLVAVSIGISKLLKALLGVLGGVLMVLAAPIVVCILVFEVLRRLADGQLFDDAISDFHADFHRSAEERRWENLGEVVAEIASTRWRLR